MVRDSEIEFSKEELIQMAPRFGFKIAYSENRLVLKPTFDLKRKENAGVLLFFLISFIPFGLIAFSEGIFVKSVMVLLGGFFLVMSILTLIKQHSDFLSVQIGSLTSKNSLKTVSLSASEIQSVECRRTNHTTKRNNSSPYTFRIIELWAHTNSNEYRIFDFGGDSRFQSKLDQLGFLIKELTDEKLLTKTGDAL